MNKEEILEKIKNFLKKSTKIQRLGAGIFLVIILMVVIAAINPSKKLLERRNSQRRSDVVNILNSVYQYSIDNGGALPATITSEPKMICRSEALFCDGLVDLSEVVVNKKYLLSSVPVDPKEKTANSSGYQIYKLSSGRLSVVAPLAENNAVISLSK